MSELRSDEEKLGLVLRQVGAVRARLNSLALQDCLFNFLALAICAGVVTIVAAWALGPLAVLIIAALGIAVTLAGAVAWSRRALAMCVTIAKAAAVADDRVDLKGRLSTVTELAGDARRTKLWSFLLEDALRLKDDFLPSRVEPRLLSRAVYRLLAAGLVAALLTPLVLAGAGAKANSAPAMTRMDATADIGSLEVRPADPASNANVQVYADAATLRKLADKLAAARAASGSRRWSRLMDRARELGAAVQKGLTGRDNSSPPMRLRLTDKNGDRTVARGDGHGSSGSATGSKAEPPYAAAAGHANSGAAVGGHKPPAAGIPGGPPEPDQLADNGNLPGGLLIAPGTGKPPGNTAHSDSADGATDGPLSGGASHGSGSEPDTLFGPPDRTVLGSDRFKISVDAEPATEGSPKGAETRPDERVSERLNPTQYPDEPLVRTSVPAADQATIKQVFQR